VDEPSSRLSPAPGVTEGVFRGRETRRWLKARLATHQLAGISTTPVQSELVTNFLTHGGGAPTVRATVALSVCDEVSDLARVSRGEGAGVPDASGGMARTSSG
jgi:hypothetical protein